MATKQVELANPNGCLNRAADEEPIFVLRAHDPDAPTAIVHWALLYKTRKGAENMTTEQRAKFDEAIALALEMKSWYRANVQPPSGPRTAVEGDL